MPKQKWTPVPGTKILVSDDKKDWHERKFIGMDGRRFVVRGMCRRPQEYYNWKYAKQK